MTTGKLLVISAFNKNDEGELIPAFDPRQVDTEARAAELLAGNHAGAVAWSRDADPMLDEYRPPTIF